MLKNLNKKANELESHSVPSTCSTQDTLLCSVKRRITAITLFVVFKLIQQLTALRLRTSLFKVSWNVKSNWRRVVTLMKWLCTAQNKTSLTSYSYSQWMSEFLGSSMPTLNSRVKVNANSDPSALSLTVEITPSVPVAYVNVSMIAKPKSEVNNE